MIKKFGYLLLLGLMACSGGNHKSTLSVSIEPQRKILEEIVGDKFDVVTVMANGANPETYDPSMAQRVDVNKSAIYFITGYLPFEQALSDGLDNTRLVNTSYGIDRIVGTHSHDGGDTDIDPHTWTSLRNGQIIARNMLDAVAALDPNNKELYTQNYAKLVSRLDSLDAVTAQRLADNDVHAFVVWHPSLSYFARDYGLHQIAVGQESKELSVANLRDVINEARADSVKVFFFQKEFDSRQAESLNKEIGSELITIDPLAYDWEAELMRVTNELAK